MLEQTAVKNMIENCDSSVKNISQNLPFSGGWCNELSPNRCIWPVIQRLMEFKLLTIGSCVLV